jgi:hypothetical protein
VTHEPPSLTVRGMPTDVRCEPYARPTRGRRTDPRQPQSAADFSDVVGGTTAAPPLKTNTRVARSTRRSRANVRAATPPAWLLEARRHAHEVLVAVIAECDVCRVSTRRWPALRARRASSDHSGLSRRATSASSGQPEDSCTHRANSHRRTRSRSRSRRAAILSTNLSGLACRRAGQLSRCWMTS